MGRARTLTPPLSLYPAAEVTPANALTHPRCLVGHHAPPWAEQEKLSPRAEHNVRPSNRALGAKLLSHQRTPPVPSSSIFLRRAIALSALPSTTLLSYAHRPAPRTYTRPPLPAAPPIQLASRKPCTPTTLSPPPVDEGEVAPLFWRRWLSTWDFWGGKGRRPSGRKGEVLIWAPLLLK